MNNHIVDTDIAIRLDRYLKRIIPSLTQGIIEQSLRLGKIKVNEKKSQSSFRLESGDVISIANNLYLQPEDTNVSSLIMSTTEGTIKLAGKIKNGYLLFENDHFLVLNKPAGLATQGGSKITLSIDDALGYMNSKNNTTLKLVHRLDKETSGILLIAKTYYAANKLAGAFSEKFIRKKYYAAVLGRPPKDEGEISNFLVKNREGVYDKVHEDQENGKLAITHYKIIKKLKGISIMEFTPLTGRTHQLRVHAQMLGCPIIGDSKYGGKDQPPHIRNMLLHAITVTLPSQIFGEEYSFEAPIPSYFKKIIDNIDRSK